MKHIAFALTLLATPVAAQTAIEHLSLPSDVCVPRSTVLTTMTSKGFTRLATGTLADGRVLDDWHNPALGYWVAVVTQPISGRLRPTSCAKIFADSEAGIFLPGVGQ